MFIRLLKGPQPSNILLIILFSCLLWLKLFMVGNIPNQQYFVPFLNNIDSYFESDLTTFFRILVFTLVVFESFYIVRLNVKYIFIDKRTFFPSIVYILWITLMFGSKHFHASVIANFFIMFALENILQLKQGRLNIRIVFNAGILIGLASVFYWPSVFLVMAFWFVSMVLHGANWRGFFTQVLGLFVPWMFIFFTYYMLGDHSVYPYLYNEITSERMFQFHYDLASIRIYVMVFLTFIGLVYYFVRFIEKKIVVRKYYAGLFWFIVVIVAAMVFVPSAGQAAIIMAAIPATIFLSNQYLRSKTPLFAEFFFTLLTAAATVWVVMI